MLYLCSEIPNPSADWEAGLAVEGIAGYSKALFSSSCMVDEALESRLKRRELPH